MNQNEGLSIYLHSRITLTCFFMPKHRIATHTHKHTHRLIGLKSHSGGVGRNMLQPWTPLEKFPISCVRSVTITNVRVDIIILIQCHFPTVLEVCCVGYFCSHVVWEKRIKDTAARWDPFIIVFKPFRGIVGHRNCAQLDGPNLPILRFLAIYSILCLRQCAVWWWGWWWWWGGGVLQFLGPEIGCRVRNNPQ